MSLDHFPPQLLFLIIQTGRFFAKTEQGEYIIAEMLRNVTLILTVILNAIK